MKCPNCGIHSTYISEGETLVGYSRHIDSKGISHLHDDNCQKRYYQCSCGTKWIESIRRTCSNKNCNWKGKESCPCHKGMKVDKWSD